MEQNTHSTSQWLVASYFGTWLKLPALTTLLPLLFATYNHSFSQTITPQHIEESIRRIDLFDGVEDMSVQMSTSAQTDKASHIFIDIPLRIIEYTQILKLNKTQNNRILKTLNDILREVTPYDYFHLSYYFKLLHLTEELVVSKNQQKLLQMLKAETKLAIQLPEIIKNHSFAEEFWLYAIQFYPTEVLTKFNQIYLEPYGLKIIEEIALLAPTVIKEYFGTHHINFRMLKESQNPQVKLLLDIYQIYGSASKSYLLINEIAFHRLPIAQAHQIASNTPDLFNKLLEMKRKPQMLGQYCVEKEIQAISMEYVVEMNLRHEDNDQYRFKPIHQATAEQIYFYMVYTPEEIFTSTFIGMYQKMKEKMSVKSGYAFLESMNFTHFRTFLKQCAGYGKLMDFIQTMSKQEMEKMIERMCQDLEKTGGNLGPAVDVADFYGSVSQTDIRQALKTAVQKNLVHQAINDQISGIKIYGLLYKIMGGNPEDFSGHFDFQLPPLHKIPSQDLFINNRHIQQHFFYDDEDGKTAFNHFVNLFGSDWKKIDHGPYLLLTFGNPKSMEIYLIKPDKEFEGREKLRALFEQQKRYPDVMVHRGHSYYLDHTLEHMTNHNKLAILGSCGGYQNISKAMENAIDVQIISTKQIGTMAVNAVLIMEIIDTIKAGKDIVWSELWQRVKQKVGGNPKFNDYVPPHLNMGARFIKAYNSLQERS
jgi:hypothetical protein